MAKAAVPAAELCSLLVRKESAVPAGRLETAVKSSTLLRSKVRADCTSA
jgi:hypothetical protein